MATKHQCVQGSSFAYDITCDEVQTFDANWSATWAIVENLDDLSDQNDLTTLASGSVGKSGDTTTFELRILPADTADIPVGYYTLVVEVSNATLGFAEEIMQDQFEITPQGIA